MYFCNCTLAGTKACENCSNSVKNSLQVFKDLWESQPVTYYFTNWQTYNPETHELVEKKEAKIKRLKESLETSKRQKDNNKALIEQSYAKIVECQNNIKVCEDDISNLTQELRELEKE
jgi:peptidoglycan hydrolase CwlO-like protein